MAKENEDETKDATEDIAPKEADETGAAERAEAVRTGRLHDTATKEDEAAALAEDIDKMHQSQETQEAARVQVRETEEDK